MPLVLLVIGWLVVYSPQTLQTAVQFYMPSEYKKGFRRWALSGWDDDYHRWYWSNGYYPVDSQIITYVASLIRKYGRMITGSFSFEKDFAVKDMLAYLSKSKFIRGQLSGVRKTSKRFVNETIVTSVKSKGGAVFQIKLLG